MEKRAKNGAILVRLPQEEIEALREIARRERMRTGEIVTPTSLLRETARVLSGQVAR